MEFFFYKVVARIVAAYLAVDCARKIRDGVRDGKIGLYQPDFLDWWSNWVVERDAAPIRYWIQVALQAGLFLCCAFVAVFGWQRPDP